MHYHIVTALTVISSMCTTLIPMTNALTFRYRLGKLYVNGLLRNLNVRDKLKASMQANSMCRRSIVTVGSAVPFNKVSRPALERDPLLIYVVIVPKFDDDRRHVDRRYVKHPWNGKNGTSGGRWILERGPSVRGTVAPEQSRGLYGSGC